MTERPRPFTKGCTVATPAQWVEGARLRTLPMAAAPVIAGTAAAQTLYELSLIHI